MFFFFQAEDGIRDSSVTGVQTCALPISARSKFISRNRSEALANQMRRMINLMALAAIFAVFAVPALAQTKECNDEFKSTTYQKWWDNRKEHQDVAYQAAKEYLATCTTEDQYSKALAKFVKAYDAQSANVTTRKQFEEAFQTTNYLDQITRCTSILATEPS